MIARVAFKYYTMNNIKQIKLEFEKIKEDRFLNAQSKKERLKINFIKFIYINLWQKVQSLLVFKLRIKKPLVKVQTFWGEEITMVLPRPSFLYFYGFLGKSELSLTDYLINNLKDCDVFIDGGANIGFYTLLASDLVGLNGSVHSFEPGKDTFNILKTNSQSKANVHLNELALWQRTEQVYFSSQDIKDNLYGSITDSNDAKSIVTEAISIDDYCERNQITPTVIKLDTEGTEVSIIKGSLNTIKNTQPIILVEILAESIKTGLYEEFVSALSPYSYKCFQMINDYSLKEISHRDEIDLRFYNYVFSPY